MNIKYILEEFTDQTQSSFEYREADIRDAIVDEETALKLKTIFGEEYWPKLERWLKSLLNKVKVKEEETNRPGGALKAKLEKYLEFETPNYESNIEILAREIVNSYNDWSKKQIKDLDLPEPRFAKRRKNNAEKTKNT